MLSDKQLKKKFRPKFHKNYSKFYPVKSLKHMGYSRNLCKKCKKGFWSIEKRDFCDDCVEEYTFIGKSPAKKKVGYREAWDLFVKTFNKWGYKPIDRYPVVARWYDELFFVDAGINIFQPYVITGQVEPPAYKTLEPQFCLRFNDVENVGYTGRHNTGFIMAGQHTFNTKKKKTFFKDQGIKQIHEFLTKSLKIPAKEIVYHEDMWAGGGNFGPCMEFFSGGLELGNQVYIQYGTNGSGYRELDTRAIDMGAGLERWAWFTQGKITSYESVFPYVLRNIVKKIDFRKDNKIFRDFSQYSIGFNADEKNIEKQWKNIANKTGHPLGELKMAVNKHADLYSIADHTRTLLVAMHDGGLPSNVGGGHNLRNILRRCWSIIDARQWDLDLKDVFEWQKKEFGAWFTELKDTDNLHDILEVEKKRYDKSIKKGRKKVYKRIKKGLNRKDFLTLYESFGVTPEQVKMMASEMGKRIDLPQNIYDDLEKKKPKKRKKKRFDSSGVITEKMYYEKPEKMEFEANVIKRKGKWVALDTTLFYPTSGGQMHDTGTISGIRVLDVVQEGKAIWHKLSKTMKSRKVEGKIDPKRRRILEQMHTGTHVLNGACQRILGSHVWQHGAEKTPEKARLDITHYKSLSKQEIKDIELLANQVIMENRPVTMKEMDRGEAEKKHGMRIYQGGAVPGKKLRIVEVKDWDIEACGGLHCQTTGEIGFLKILSTERIQDGVVRINFVVGEPMLEIVWEHENIIDDLQELWGVVPDQIPKTAERFFKEWKSQQNKIEKIAEKMALDSIKKGDKKKQVIEIPTKNMGLLTKIAKKSGFKGTLVLVGNGVGYGMGKGAEKELEKYFKKVKGQNPYRAW